MAQPIVRISKGRFAPEKYPQVRELIEDSAKPLVPARKICEDYSTTTQRSIR